MGYKMENGRWADTDDLTLADALAVSGDTDGDSVELGDCGVARLTLTVAAIGAGTTLTVYIETSADDTTFRAVSNFTAIAAPGAEILSFSGLDRFVRARYSFAGGTTTATVSISGEAV
ncbi:MAG: hypothetical protein WC683_17850 [bacterium]